MRSLLVALSFSVLASVTLAPLAAAQFSPWQAYPTLRDAQSLSASDDAIWVGTDGGVYRYAITSGEIERYTPVQGLAGVDARAVAFDARRQAVWIGYPGGLLDRLDVTSGEIETLVDIARADRFASRTIHRIEVAGDSLFISTDFGLVVFDAEANEVRDAYERFGTFPAGTPTFDALRAPIPDGRDGLWVGTREGVAYAPLDAVNLREPTAWTVDPSGPRNVTSLASFQGQVFAGTGLVQETEAGTLVVAEEGGVYVRDAEWTLLPYGTVPARNLVAEGDRLIITSLLEITIRAADGSVARYDSEGLFNFNSAILGPGGKLWAGERFNGLLAYTLLAPPPTGFVDPDVRVIPDGPGTGNVLTVEATSDGAVWAGFFSQNDAVTAFARFDGSQWTNYSAAAGNLDARSPILDIIRDETGNVWLGSEGVGVFQVNAEGEVTRYTIGNSSLAGSGGSSTYVEVNSLAVDDDNNVWMTNRLADPPLHVRTPAGEWAGLRRPPGLPSTVTYRDLTIDTFGQKWLSLRSTVTNAGGGLAVIDTGGTPLDDSDDRAVFVGNIGTVGAGLPNEDIRAIEEDRSGRIWIGTARGLATVFSAGSIFSGDPAGQIAWARTPDETSFFLRDLEIYDIAVDPADRKWLASSSGVWLLNAEGNAVIENFTTENSPLPSDEVLAVDIDESDGTVYLATSGGVYSYRGGSIAPVPEAEDLFVYPNPVRAEGGSLPGIAITGLIDNADVRVLTVDGQLVAAFATRGGSVQWDGRDQRTGDFVPSGVYLIAAEGEGGTAYGKVAVIR